MNDEEKEPILAKTSTLPKDRLYLVYAIFYVLGIGTLLPWNFFSNAKDYFSYKLRNVSATNETTYKDPQYATHLQLMFESYLTIAAMVPNILFMFLNTAVTKLISLRLRIVVASLVMILNFILAIAFTRIQTDDWQYTFFSVTIISIVIMNAGSAILQGGIFGYSGLFPPNYTQAVMSGMGMGGTIAAVANLIVISLGSDPTESGFGYFLIAEVVLVIALVGYLMLPYLKYARYHNEVYQTYQYVTDVGADRERACSVNSSSDLSDSERLTEHSSIEQSGHADTLNSQDRDLYLKIQNNPSVGSSLFQVFKQIWVYALSVFLVFFVTLSCYPSVNSAIQSAESKDYHSVWATKYFTPVTCFLAFNLCDWFGRSIAGPIHWPKEGSPLIPLFCVLRVVFIPLFLMCNIEPRRMTLIPNLFNADWIPALLMVLFALSNGYLGTLCMMYGPRQVGAEDIETAGSMMSFFLSSGLGIGALASLLIMTIIQQV